MAVVYSAYHQSIQRPAAPGIGALLRYWRDERGMSAKRLARIINCNHTTLSRIESGSRGVSREMAIRLADALELTGAHRVKFLGTCLVLEHPLTDAQSSYLAASH